MNHRMHVPAPYVHPIYTDGQIDTPVATNSPLPVIARDTRLILYNPNTIVVSATSGQFTNIDPLGTSGTNPPPTIELPDAWRVRRVIVVALRESTGDLQCTLEARLYGRLVDNSGNPVNATWFVGGGASIGNANDGGAIGGVRFTRLVMPSTLSGVLGFDQYRITFHRSSVTGTGELRLSHIKVYAEF